MVDIFKKRRAVRHYLPKLVTKKKIKQILTAAMYAPSGYNKHPLHFIIVRRNEIKEKLSQTNQWSSYVDKAAAIIIVCANDKQSMVWLEDASIAVGYMWLKCTQLGLGACWIHIHGSLRINKGKSEEYVKQLLKIPANLRVVCFLAIGYPIEKPLFHSEAEYLNKKVHYEKWP
ncbi:MAG: nitroreductase family protein [bacterium]